MSSQPQEDDDPFVEPIDPPGGSTSAQNPSLSAPLAPLLARFERIGLDEIEAVALMNRVDSKYWFPVTFLPRIFAAIAAEYRLLEIEGETLQRYKTTYYDTAQDAFYLAHLNDRCNRIKVRTREYVASKRHFLEVKRKTQKGLTRKTRLETAALPTPFPAAEAAFLARQMDPRPSALLPKIRSEFRRITLVNRNLQERATIDLNLSFYVGDRARTLSPLAIIELKRENGRVESALRTTLRDLHIRPIGFSKYCLGRALLQPELKRNRLKPSLLRIQKLASA